MLLPSFFIVDFEKSGGTPGIPLPENGYLCYRISAANMDGSATIHKSLLSSYKKNEFCLLVSSDKDEAAFEKMIHSLVRYTFFYNYLKFDYENPFLILEIQQGNSEKYVDLVKSVFNQHGYKDVDLVVMNKSVASPPDFGSDAWFDLRTGNDDFASRYTNTIIQTSSANPIACFLINEYRQLPGLFHMIEETESMISRQSPQVYQLLVAQNTARKKQQQMRFQLGLQQEQIDSMNNYHSFYNSAEHRYGRQVKELMTFYKNEYEILPMWYKQFGHVIKVITGKRTFRSLFNDNVKKYKE